MVIAFGGVAVHARSSRSLTSCFRTCKKPDAWLPENRPPKHRASPAPAWEQIVVQTPSRVSVVGELLREEHSSAL